MNRLLIDTNIYVAFKRGNPAVVELLGRAEKIVLCSVVIGELLAGFRSGNQASKNRQQLESFSANARVGTCSLNANTAEFYAAVFTQLKQKGRPIPTNDMWIAASAMQNGLAICTLDAHFESIDGILIRHPVS
ncbi:MAG: type II toxin-antitoxin system VapC family toxin [Opitutaceae bacterium]|jgi:tRNA(fMet)-specific endonuclease VapC|nr:type II toxin-antitoxin system VapC family toxin [Opitutaceae bacterium]